MRFINLRVDRAVGWKYLFNRKERKERREQSAEMRERIKAWIAIFAVFVISAVKNELGRRSYFAAL
jgi:hypothetical protein